MIRKTIQIAETTQVISLPKEWTKEYNIIKGTNYRLLFLAYH
ncbi:MAG TPA: hypothetical protein VJB89_03810 [Candidatus Nanoarchaeia archaeon]|nr:hypothetical protein [Candidatus Nanoarchaeia archaeon]